MPDGYTQVNLREVKDSAPDLGAADFQESHFATEALGSTEIGVTHHRYLPGKRQAFAHRHGQATEYYVVVAGAGRVKLGDDIIELAPLDAFRVDPQTFRTWEAGPDGMEVVAFGARNDGDQETVPSDAEIVKGWWID